MKYIPAEKLIAEVERLRPRFRKIGGKDVLVTTDSVYKKLNRIIDFARSLQQEQPDVDLEKEIQSFWNANALEYRLGHVADINFLAYTARHFYEFGLNAKKEK